MINLAKFLPTQWRLNTHLPNGNELSTVELPPLRESRPNRFESCWFYADGTSEVVATHPDRETAIKEHHELVQLARG